MTDDPAERLALLKDEFITPGSQEQGVHPLSGPQEKHSAWPGSKTEGPLPRVLIIMRQKVIWQGHPLMPRKQNPEVGAYGWRFVLRFCGSWRRRQPWPCSLERGTRCLLYKSRSGKAHAFQRSGVGEDGARRSLTSAVCRPAYVPSR